MTPDPTQELVVPPRLRFSERKLWDEQPACRELLARVSRQRESHEQLKVAHQALEVRVRELERVLKLIRKDGTTPQWMIGHIDYALSAFNNQPTGTEGDK